MDTLQDAIARRCEESPDFAAWWADYLRTMWRYWPVT